MSEVMQEMLDSLAKIGEQWDLVESVGRVWGFLLFKSCTVTQREIEEDFSRSLTRIQETEPRCSPVLEDNRRYKYDAWGCRERRGSGKEDFNKNSNIKEAIRNE
jgi:hypothetical protein